MLLKINYKNILLATLLALIAIVFAMVSDLNASDIKVKVKQFTWGFVSIEDIPYNIQILPLPACFVSTVSIDDEDLSRNMCQTQKQIDIMVLETQIGGIEESINSIDKQLYRLNDTAKYFKSFSKENLNGLNLIFIPAGELSQQTNRRADNIQTKCLMDSGGIFGDVWQIGTLGSFKSSFFDFTPPSALKALATMLDSLPELQSLEDQMTEDYEKFIKENGEDKKEKYRPPITIMNKMADIFKNNQKLTEMYFIPVLSRNLTTEKNYTSLSLDWILKDGKRDVINIPFWLSVLIKAFTGDWLTQTTNMRITLDFMLNGDVDGIFMSRHRSLSKFSLIPEPNIFQGLQKTMAQHIKTYETIKLSLQKKKEVLIKQLLVTNNYNCQ